MMRLVLQASVAALVNVQCVETVDAEIKRRAVVGELRGNVAPLLFEELHGR